jgi:HEPN domain-containing protein
LTDEPVEPETIPDHIVGPERTLMHAFNLWITPEVKRRAAAGQITLPINLRFAQVLFQPGEAPKVRLNKEVRGSMQVKPAKPFKAGDPVYSSDIEAIERFELEPSEADSGHFTVFRQNNQWVMVFDFQTNKGKATDLVRLAQDFLDTAKFAASNGKSGPFIDNLFSCCELLAKARLITSAAEKQLRSHGAIHSQINMWGKLGNVDGKFVELFNELSNARSKARYNAGNEIAVTMGSDAMDCAGAEIELLKARLARFSDDL